MNKQYKYLTLTQDERVLICSIANPPTNTLNSEGVLELLDLCSNLQEEKYVRVLVLIGADPEIFIRHYEVGELSKRANRKKKDISSNSNKNDTEKTKRLNNLHLLCLQLESLNAITIAAINGNAAGGGCELTLACDFRLISNSVSNYGLPETTIGIIPGAGGTIRLPKIVGLPTAMDMILHAKLITTEEAMDIGMVHRVFEKDLFMSSVLEFSHDIANRAPLAVTAAKHSLHSGLGLNIKSALASEQKYFSQVISTKDAAGSMKAMLYGEQWEWCGE
ncbi:MAG: enoyl-CoA hydratase/isomerase family protein [Kangiellaceae bacterium]|nr:enoyl-CoA hydratase/isomerase family protein [Kangiellaceae bacterium]